MEANEMRRWDGKETISENKAQRKPIAKKSQSDHKIPNIAAMDNETMVESLKFLSYWQLATSSLVSKRFLNLICTHRHKLALLYVNRIHMGSFVTKLDPALIQMFKDVLLKNKYNEFIARNGYSKQVPLEGQIAIKENAENGHALYELQADAYHYSNHYRFAVAKNVLYAQVKLNDESWPVFQHFIRLLMDPFIYIRTLKLKPQKYVFSLIAGAMNPDRDRLKCKLLNICFNNDNQNLIIWTKDHVLCDECEINFDSNSNFNEELLDLFLTGAPFTSAFNVRNYDLSKVIVNFAQKFMGLKNGDEYQTVKSICGYVKDRGIVKELTRNFAEFIAEQEQLEDGSGTRQVVGFINNDIAKKLTLDIKNLLFSIKITDL